MRHRAGVRSIWCRSLRGGVDLSALLNPLIITRTNHASPDLKGASIREPLAILGHSI
jgi:hypothetical protein